MIGNQWMATGDPSNMEWVQIGNDLSSYPGKITTDTALNLDNANLHIYYMYL